MNKIIINDNEYEIDIEKAKELGVLKKINKFSLMPERGGDYFCIGTEGGLCGSIMDTMDSGDTRSYNSGNYFKSKEVAEYIIKHKLNPFCKITNYIAHKNVENGWEPSWEENNSQRKWFLEFCCNFAQEQYLLGNSIIFNKINTPYTSEETARELAEYLNENKDVI